MSIIRVGTRPRLLRALVQGREGPQGGGPLVLLRLVGRGGMCLVCCVWKPVLQSGRARLRRRNKRPRSVPAPCDTHVFPFPTQFTAGPDESIITPHFCLLVCLFAGLSMNWDFCLLQLKGSSDKHVGIRFGGKEHHRRREIEAAPGSGGLRVYCNMDLGSRLLPGQDSQSYTSRFPYFMKRKLR